jgi:RHS repeat-associated protein
MKYILIIILNLQILAVTAKDLELGLLDNIEEAVKSVMPLQQELNVFVEIGPDGYTIPMELDASTLQMNGFAIEISGHAATHKLKSKSVYFDDDLVVEYDAETGNENKYINAVGPEGIDGRVDISGGTDLVYYYLKDHLGSITGSVFEAQLQEAKFYYAYGNTDRLSVAAKKSKEGFTGKEFDEDGYVENVSEGINLHYFGARYFDSEIGLWISPDPARQFASPYATSGNPINSIDPDGLREVPANFIGPLQQKDWRAGDPAGFAEAAEFNLMHQGQNEYAVIEQRGAFYQWVADQAAIQGSDVKWPQAAANVVNGDIQILQYIPGFYNWAHEGNKAIFDDAFPGMKNLLTKAPLKGSAARRWDSNQLRTEQMVIEPYYGRIGWYGRTALKLGNLLVNGEMVNLGDINTRLMYGEAAMQGLRK